MNERIRISDADRESVAARLREHFAEGRLTQDELDERISATFSAKTFGDLGPVLADLPGSATMSPWPQARQAPPWAGQRGPIAVHRGPRIFPLAMFALMWPATYSSEKSCDSKAVHRPIDARRTIANVAYIPRTPLRTRSSRRSIAPEKSLEYPALTAAIASD